MLKVRTGPDWQRDLRTLQALPVPDPRPRRVHGRRSGPTRCLRARDRPAAGRPRCALVRRALHRGIVAAIAALCASRRSQSPTASTSTAARTHSTPSRAAGHRAPTGRLDQRGHHRVPEIANLGRTTAHGWCQTCALGRSRSRRTSCSPEQCPRSGRRVPVATSLRRGRNWASERHSPRRLSDGTIEIPSRPGLGVALTSRPRRPPVPRRRGIASPARSVATRPLRR